MEVVSVSLHNLIEEFIERFRHFQSMYKEILNPESISRLQQIHKSWKFGRDGEFDSDLWSKNLYDFGYTYQLRQRNKRRLTDKITSFYFGSTKNYYEQVVNMISNEADEVIREPARVFEKKKPPIWSNGSPFGKSKQIFDNYDSVIPFLILMSL